MTAPIWAALPPEVPSALLSSGPGPGSLLAGAGAWNALSVEYASVAEELSAVLAAVLAGGWQGPSAQAYLAAHVPYLAWLMQASAASAVAAAQHEVAAAAYTAAVAAMPTLAELAANHLTHGVLVATNFFGINSIPIALNEADYVRMWVQAATTMSVYQAVSGAAVASTPPTDPAPQIVKSAAAAQTGQGQPGSPTGLGDLLAALLQKLGVSNQFVDEFGIDNIFRFLDNPVGYIESHFIHRLLTDPLSLLVNPLYLFYDGDEAFFSLGYAFLPASAGLAVVAPAGSAAALAGLAGLAPAAPAPVDAAPAPPLAPAVPATMSAAGMAPPIGATGVAPATAPPPATAPAASAVAGSAPPPAAAGAAMAFPYLVGPPGIGFGSGAGTRGNAVVRKKAPAPDTTAAAAAATAREQARAQRRRRAKLRGHGDEFMDMGVQVDPDWGGPSGGPVASTVASDHGAGPLGFAGTVRKETVAAAAGLVTLAVDRFDGGLTAPMVPGTWEPDGEPNSS